MYTDLKLDYVKHSIKYLDSPKNVNHKIEKRSLSLIYLSFYRFYKILFFKIHVIKDLDNIYTKCK